MRHSNTARMCTVGAVFAMLGIAVLVRAAHTDSTMTPGRLPGIDLNAFTSQYICVGSEAPVNGSSKCSGNVGNAACATTTVNGVGYQCSNEGVACGSGSNEGANNQECSGSDGGCACQQNGHCCWVSVDACYTSGSGTREDPYSCTCTTPTTDVEVLSRVVCSQT